VGVSNIREYESSKLSRSEAAIKRKREILEHKKKLEATLQYEETRDLKSPLNDALAKVEEVKNKISKFEKQVRMTTSIVCKISLLSLSWP
jgi:hypothetical protein